MQLQRRKIQKTANFGLPKAGKITKSNVFFNNKNSSKICVFAENVEFFQKMVKNRPYFGVAP
jgi:hypothetical protein